MARRTGREGVYTRVVGKDLDEAKRRIEEREARLEALGFEPVSDEQRTLNNLLHELKDADR